MSSNTELPAEVSQSPPYESGPHAIYCFIKNIIITVAVCIAKRCARIAGHLVGAIDGWETRFEKSTYQTIDFAACSDTVPKTKA